MTALPAPVSRLSPCPCGSGKRYKDCHGALAVGAAGASPAGAAPRSRYRPTGPDWASVPDDERDRLGTLMEAALAHQRAGRAREAERCYRQVLAVAPSTHDALHMLGMVRWGEGDFDGARRLIEQALPLRPEYPAIRQNLAIVTSAQRAHERSAQEALCEKALPAMFELLAPEGRAPDAPRARAAGTGDATIHLIGLDDGSDGDDAWMLRRLAALLAPLSPVVWIARGSGVPARDGIRVITGDGDSGEFPRGGVQVYAGVDADFTAWLPRSDPERTVVFAQCAPPSRWLDTLRAIAADGERPLGLVAESHAKAERFGTGHRVLPPPIDLDSTRGTERETARDGAFVVGSVVQDGRNVARARTGSLVDAVAAKGVDLHLYDPGRVRHALGAARNVTCLSRRDVALPRFLAPLSCYLHRSEAWWQEGSGRDLFAAMALGVAVVCPRASIYAEYLRDGVDGLLYDDDDGALECVAALRDDPARTAALGAAARETALRLFDPTTLAAAYRRFIAGA